MAHIEVEAIGMAATRKQSYNPQRVKRKVTRLLRGPLVVRPLCADSRQVIGKGKREDRFEMFLFTFRSKINPKSKEARLRSDVGGAYVNCWINFKDFQAAEKLAKLLIREQGWIPEIKTRESRIQKRLLKKKKEKQYYAEAIKYGYSLVFHLWPKDAPDANRDYESEEEGKGTVTQNRV